MEDRDDDCIYSHPSVSYDYLQDSADASTAVDGYESPVSWKLLHDSTTCGSDYPYCFSDEGECRKLNDYPWRNQGLDHIHLQEYMSW